MRILGIESTCDETAAAVVKNGKTIEGHSIATSMELHRRYGGVYPELACRGHIDAVIPVIETAMQQANVSSHEIDGIGVANSPGLIGALLIGLHVAKGLALSWKKPLFGINHVEAHLYASMMGEIPPFPALGLVISGGHTLLLSAESFSFYELVGTTVDDSLGEAFDKVASLLSLPYPGGPAIEALALRGNPTRYSFHAGKVKKNPHAFSFSGLKTAVRYALQAERVLTDQICSDIAASFQQAAIQDLIAKTSFAMTRFSCKSLIFGGGVCNNSFLRTSFAKAFRDLPLFWPPPGLSSDNAAMIAGLAYHKALQNSEGDSLSLEASSRSIFWKSS